MFLVLVGKLQANVWFTSAVPRLLHPGYFFQVSINLLRRGQLFSLRLHEHLVQPSHLLNWNLLFHNITFARWSIVGVSFVLL